MTVKRNISKPSKGFKVSDLINRLQELKVSVGNVGVFFDEDRKEPVVNACAYHTESKYKKNVIVSHIWIYSNKSYNRKNWKHD